MLAGVAATAAIVAVVVALVLDNQHDGGPRAPSDSTTTTVPAHGSPPTGLTAVESAAGVQLDWDGDDSASYAILMLSETAAPKVVPAEAGASLLIPATSLRADDAYCFAVAYLDALETVDHSEDAFSPPTCIRGASEDTVRAS
jgi:hypothetical protein